MNIPGEGIVNISSPKGNSKRTGAKTPAWLRSIGEGYNSGATDCFLVYGNVSDIFSLEGADLSLRNYLAETCGERDIIVHADPACGILIEKGNKSSEEGIELIEGEGHIMERLHRFMLFVANLQTRQDTTVFITNANYLVGEQNDFKGGLIIKRWTEDPHFQQKGILIFLIAESLKDIHPTVLNNRRLQKVEIPFPNEEEVLGFLASRKNSYPIALEEISSEEKLERMANAMAGTSRQALLSLIKKANYAKRPLIFADLEETKKRIVEQESQGLITFLTPKNTLADLAGSHSRAIQDQFEGDIALWNSGRTELMPNGYLIVGPSGTGKSFFLRCLAGSAGVPVMMLNNFRDQFQGGTEANLELIFRLAKSMPRVYLAIDEADQTLGSRSQSNTDGGVSGRVYSYFAQEMSNLDNRGRICWILLTSHPQNLEVDLKRPGRCDVRIPLLPCENPRAGAELIAVIAKRSGLNVSEGKIIDGPELLTPGGATTIVEEAIRLKAKGQAQSTDTKTLNRLIASYQSPDHTKMWNLTKAAIAEASSKDFIPKDWQKFANGET